MLKTSTSSSNLRTKGPDQSKVIPLCSEQALRARITVQVCGSCRLSPAPHSFLLRWALYRVTWFLPSTVRVTVLLAASIEGIGPQQHTHNYTQGLVQTSSMVLWESISLPHRLLSDVPFQGCQACILIHQLSLMVKDVWAWVALFTKLLKPFWLLFPGNVVTRLLLIFHSGDSGVPTQSEIIWSQFNILPLTHYSRLALAASCRKLLCWTEASPHGSNGITCIYICWAHIYICSSEWSLHVRKFACQLHITGVSLLSGGPSISWCRANNSSKAFRQAASLPCLL